MSGRKKFKFKKLRKNEDHEVADFEGFLPEDISYAKSRNNVNYYFYAFDSSEHISEPHIPPGSFEIIPEPHLTPELSELIQSLK